MALLTVARDYVVWHYSVAYIDMLHIWWNYLWFINHLFSVHDVARSWISPFRRLQEEKVGILKDAQGFFANLFINVIMRMVGFVIRTALMLIALFCFAAVVAVGLWFILFWTVLPFLIILFITSGFTSLFS